MIKSETNAPFYAKIGKIGFILAVAGLLLFALGGLLHLSSHTILQSYLYGWLFGMLFTMGCYGMMLMYYMTRAAWGKTTIRLLEAGARLLPLMLILFLPIMIWHANLYPWADPTKVKAEEILRWRGAWMNDIAWVIRTFAYFGLWSGFTYYLSDLSRKQDVNNDFRLEKWRQKVSTVGFLLFMITMTLAFTDWVMSLDVHWFSTIYGPWFVVFSGLAAVSFMSIVVNIQKIAKIEPYATLVTKDTIRDIGNLTLMLTMLWAYFSLSQWLIIWSGNLPEETHFYLLRNKDAFLFVGAFNIVFSFFVPFLLLISGRTKRTPQLMLGVSCLLIFMRVIDLFWVVIPATRYPVPVITDLAAILVVMGLWLAFHTLVMRQALLIPNHETTIGAQEALQNA